MTKAQPLVQGVDVAADDQLPVDTEVGDARTGKAKDSPQRAHTDVLWQEDGIEMEEHSGGLKAVALLHRVPGEPHCRQVEELVDQDGV